MASELKDILVRFVVEVRAEVDRIVGAHGRPAPRRKGRATTPRRARAPAPSSPAAPGGAGAAPHAARAPAPVVESPPIAPPTVDGPPAPPEPGYYEVGEDIYVLGVTSIWLVQRGPEHPPVTRPIRCDALPRKAKRREEAPPYAYVPRYCWE